MRKKFTNLSARKTTVRKPKKAKIVLLLLLIARKLTFEYDQMRVVSSEHITNVTGHRGINFLNDYDEADEEELRYRLLQ